MRKKIVICVLLAALQAVFVFGQADGGKKNSGAKKNALMVDLAPLVRSEILVSDTTGFGLGVMYERIVGDTHSVGIRGEFVSVEKFLYWGAELHGRWYPLSAKKEKPFADLMLGFGSFTTDGEMISDTSQIGGISLGIRGGIKFPVVGNLFAEPTIGYTLAKGTGGYGPSGLGISLSLGCDF
jgi:hypothetical protein